MSSDIIRKEIEKIDNYLGSVLLFSLAGGTGSGLGSRFLENMRDEYPSTNLTAVVVYPASSGESPLQHYNCLLSTSYLQEYADNVVYFQNDKINKYLTRIITSQTQKIININNINEYIASLLGRMMKINDI